MSEPTEGTREFTPGTILIERERERQIEAEGWTSVHDAQHVGGELADAAACYADIAASITRGASVEELRPLILDGFDSMLTWPFDEDDFKPTEDAIRNLVKAGALIAAEIDRLQRAR
jgi:hypothetical protein